MIDLVFKVTGRRQLYVTLLLKTSTLTLTKTINYVNVLILCWVHLFFRFEFKFAYSVVRLQRRIYGANLALHYFITTHWVFKNAKFLALNDIIKREDNDDFRFDRFVTGDIRKYFISCMYGKLVDF